MQRNRIIVVADAGTTSIRTMEHGVVIPFREQGTRLPLFVIAGLGGGVLIFRQVAEALGDDQPVYGLQGVGLDGRELPLRRIEAIAERYCHEIRTIQPEGPYFLVGWSMGGIIAYELALSLMDQGAALGALVIVDEFAPVPVPQFERLCWHIHRLSGRAPGDMFRYFGRSLRRRFDLLRRRLGSHPPIPGLEGPVAERVKRSALAQAEAVRRYRPRRFPGDLAVIRADHSAEIPHPRADEPHMGWAHIVDGRVLTRTVPGSHVNIFQGPNGDALTRSIADCLGELKPRC